MIASKGQRGMTQVSRWQLVIMSVRLKYVLHRKVLKFISVKSSLSFVESKTFLPVFPKVKAEHCDQSLSPRFTKEMQLKCHFKKTTKKTVEEVEEGEQLGRSLIFLSSLPSSFHPH